MNAAGLVAALLSSAVVWGVAPVTAMEQSEASQSARGVTLRVMTLNVWHGLRSGENRKRFPGEDDERRQARFQWQIEEIQRLDPDLLLLQEVNPAQSQAQRYAEALGYDEIHKVTSCGLHLGALYKIPKNVNEGLAILARPDLDLRRVGSKRLSGNARCTASWGFQTKESRFALFGEVTIGGRRILVTTTHLFSPPFVPPGFEEALERLASNQELDPACHQEILATLELKRSRSLAESQRLVDQIERRRNRASAGRLAVILAGDFNTEPDTAAIDYLERHLRSATGGSDLLTFDPVANRVNYDIGSKRTRSLPTCERVEIAEMLDEKATTARQIDYIFVSDELEVLSTEKVMTRDRGGILPSDHFGILATVRMWVVSSEVTP